MSKDPRHDEDALTDFSTASNDSKCTCQPAPPKRGSERIQAFLLGNQPGQVRQLHQPGAELDIYCDMTRHEMTLRETVNGNPRANPSIARYDVHLDLKNSRLLNLEGLADSSILLALEIRPEACKIRGHGLRLETKVWSFRPPYADSKLHDEFYLCDWPTMILQVHLPESRIRGWKTIATLLLTFGRVTQENWRSIVNIQDGPAVAGLIWRHIEQRMRSEVKRNKLTREEERRNKDIVKPGPYELWF